MNKMELPVPKVYGIIERDNRTGIIYERICGKSLMEAISQGENLFPIFMQLQQDFLHQKSTELVSYKNFLNGSLSGKVVMDDTLAEQILVLPEGNCVCHGDFHPGNIILRTDGDRYWSMTTYISGGKNASFR